MKKISIFTMVVMLTVLMSVAMADDKGIEKAGRLYLFQKCDASLTGAGYDSVGCPTGDGPWPIYPGNRRMGKLDYTLWGKSFEFAFIGENLEPNKDYTLIYYPDPWPGKNLVCLGSGKTNSKGKIKINDTKNKPITNSLPASGDANYNLGAKIWLVLSEDIVCGTEMINWKPASYLFEYNPIVFENEEVDFRDDDDDD